MNFIYDFLEIITNSNTFSLFSLVDLNVDCYKHRLSFFKTSMSLKNVCSTEQLSIYSISSISSVLDIVFLSITHNLILILSSLIIIRLMYTNHGLVMLKISASWDFWQHFKTFLLRHFTNQLFINRWRIYVG